MNKQFNGVNYSYWSKSAQMALGVKLKIGFVDASLAKPAEGTIELQKWLQCDYMVRCWILNAFFLEISESFMYVQYAEELWKEFTERFVEANGPLIYQLHRDLTLLSEGNDPRSLYFSKMKKIWDELQDVDAASICSYGVWKSCKCSLMKKLEAKDPRNKLIRFLMGLNSGYNSMKGQILAKDPLSTVNRAYQIIQQIEKQKQVTDVMQIKQEVEVYAVNKQGPKPVVKKDQKKGKNDKYCDHCKVKGHQTDQCFKPHGYPNWYKEKYRSKMKMDAEVTSQGFDIVQDTHLASLDAAQEGQSVDTTLVSAVCQEVLKALKGRISTNASANMASNSVTSAFAGNAIAASSSVNDNSLQTSHWIVDTGASDHMSFSQTYLQIKGSLVVLFT